jgi:YYY domain-containing protein
MRPESWYWSPTRIIPIAPGEVGPITEFPAFTFLYADLHAHMMALPLALTALVLAVSWLRRRRPSWLSILLGGLVIGALYPTNTWDYPTYLFLGLVGLALGAWRGRRRPPLERWLRAVGGRALVLIGLSLVLYVPYIRRYVGGYTSFGLWEGSRTPLTIYLWIHGIVLFPLLTRLLIELRAWWRRSEDGGKRLPLLATFIMVLLGSLLLYFLGYEVALLVIPLGSLILLRLIAPHTPVSRRFLWLMVGVGLTLTLVVELIVLRGDIGRMNTVFKFYLQVWLLLSTAAAVSAAWVWARARFWPAEWRELWWIVMVALLFAGALFLPFGVRARAVDRMTPGVGLTLDGMAFMEGGVIFEGPPDSGGQEIALRGDYAAIRWLQDTVPGSPVILEGLGYREYLWGNRVSIYTGLPAVVGWRWHQVQQRAGLADAEVDRRQNDVRTFYNTSHVAEAEAILERYGVRYVYVGDYERAYYNAVGLAKLNSMVNMGVLRVAYDAQGVTIYEVLL